MASFYRYSFKQKSDFFIYRPRVNARAIAKRIRPAEEIAVSKRRTPGRERVFEDFSSAATRVKYQKEDTPVCTHAKIKIPQPREKCLGTNEGMNASAKTAAFTFVKLVATPNWYARAIDVFVPAPKSNLPNSLRNCHNVCSDKKVKKATPEYFNTEKAKCDLAKIADSPTADKVPQINNPVEFPRIE